MVRPLLPLLAAALAAGPAAAQPRPVTGDRVERFDPLDKVVQAHMDRIGATAAAVAVAKDGRRLHARGFGWRDKDKKVPTPPDALFRLASVTKPFTAAAVLASVRAGHLSLDDKALDHLRVKPAGGTLGDPRLKDVTVRHLLEHKAGWDHTGQLDPAFDLDPVAKGLKLRRPVGPADVVSYMLARKLQHDPGAKEVYANLGYVALGRVLEGAEKQPTYFDALRELVLKPAWVGDVWPGSARRRHPREAWTPANPDHTPLEAIDAAGGLVASAPGLCRYLGKYWLSGDPRRPGEVADFTVYGSLPGTTALTRQRPDGVNVVVLLNNRRDDHIDPDLDALTAAVDEAVDKAGKK